MGSSVIRIHRHSPVARRHRPAQVRRQTRTVSPVFCEAERGGEEGMAGGGLRGGGATEGLGHARFTVHQLIAEGREHLEHGVGKAELEDAAGDGLVGGVCGMSSTRQACSSPGA